MTRSIKRLAGTVAALLLSLVLYATPAQAGCGYCTDVCGSIEYGLALCHQYCNGATAYSGDCEDHPICDDYDQDYVRCNAIQT